MSKDSSLDEDSLSNFIVPDGEGEDEEPTEMDLKKIAELIKMNPFESMCHCINVFHKAQQKQENKKTRKRKSNVDEAAPIVDEIQHVETIITDVDREEVAIWYEDMKMSVSFCFNMKKTRYVKACQCFSSLDTDEAVSIFGYLSQLEHGKRETICKQFLSASDKRNKAIINIPHLKIYGKTLCCTSLCNILAISQRVYNQLMKDLKNGVAGPCSNGYKGNQNRSKNSLTKRCKPDVILLINTYGREHGETSATRFIRETTGIGIRNDEVDLLQLPSHFSKRGVYSVYVHSHGWQMLKVTQKGLYGSTSDYKKQKDDPNDDEWPDDVEPDPVCSYSSFGTIWKEECPLVVIRPKSEDICGDCYVFSNHLKYSSRCTSKDASNKNVDDDDNSSSCESNVSGTHFANKDVEMDGKHFHTEEDLILAAANHVESAKAMRAKIKECERESQVARQNNIDHSSMSYMIVVDYAQNMDVPHFGGQQPGETYYCCPKNVYVFGICDVTATPTQLHAYCYEEEHGRKGGNNIASLIMFHLQAKGLLPEDETGNAIQAGRLTIACDNCAGHNKNNMVICLANLLVERGHFNEVEILFL